MDYHIHSIFSEDSELTMDYICQRYIQLGVKQIAFTDHIDIDYPSTNYTFRINDLDEYFESIEIIKAKYKDEFNIAYGVEIGLQPHVLEECNDIVTSYPFDFVIGSVHVIKGSDPYEGQYYIGKSKIECYDLFYRETLDLIHCYDNFDVLGHLDYIRRYSPFTYQADDYLIAIEIIDEILRTLISKGKGIELNTSGYREPFDVPMPNLNILKRYKELGGQIITLGSDAHKAHQIGFKFPRAISELQQIGFEHLTTFSKRQPIPISLNLL